MESGNVNINGEWKHYFKGVQVSYDKMCDLVNNRITAMYLNAVKSGNINLYRGTTAAKELNNLLEINRELMEIEKKTKPAPKKASKRSPEMAKKQLSLAKSAPVIQTHGTPEMYKAAAAGAKAVEKEMKAAKRIGPPKRMSTKFEPGQPVTIIDESGNPASGYTFVRSTERFHVVVDKKGKETRLWFKYVMPASKGA